MTLYALAHSYRCRPSDILYDLDPLAGYFVDVEALRVATEERRDAEATAKARADAQRKLREVRGRG